jgi:hypothetical protein
MGTDNLLVTDLPLLKLKSGLAAVLWGSLIAAASLVALGGRLVPAELHSGALARVGTVGVLIGLIVCVVGARNCLTAPCAPRARLALSASLVLFIVASARALLGGLLQLLPADALRESGPVLRLLMPTSDIFHFAAVALFLVFIAQQAAGQPTALKSLSLVLLLSLLLVIAAAAAWLSAIAPVEPEWKALVLLFFGALVFANRRDLRAC